MGNTFSSQLQWTATNASVNSTRANDSLPILATNVHNQEVLTEIVKFIDSLCKNYPNEAKTEFKRPLQWVTTSKPAQFLGSSNFASAGKNKSSVQSSTNKADGTPLFSLEPSGEEKDKFFVAKVWNFDYINKVLQQAEDQKLKELQEIVQANRDPMHNISGISGKSGFLLLDAFETISKENDDTPAKKEGSQKLYKLLLLLNMFEMQLLQSTVKSLEKEKNVDIQKASEELQMLQSFCGRDPKLALKSIDWESDYIFANGYRAPPWRQVYGELCYLEVLPFDGDKFYVTATKKGYFKNRGYLSDGKGSEHLNYEKDGDVHASLVDLLKAHSKHFAETIDKQTYSYSTAASSSKSEMESALGQSKDDKAQHEHGDAKEVEFAETTTDDQGNVRKADTGKKHVVKKKSNSQNKPSTIIPSMKWRALGLTAEGIKKHSSEKSASAHHESRAEKSARRQSFRFGQNNDSDNEDEFIDNESSVSSDEEELQEKRQENSDLPAEYWQIQKLVKYLRCGNQTATIIAICSLRDFDLTNETNQLAIRDVGGLTTLINLLDTDDPKCKIGALKILKDIAQNVQIRNAIADLDGMQPLVELLKDSDEDLKCLSAETIAHCTKNARNRRDVRKYGGIRKLVRLLKAKPGSKEERVAISGAMALCSCSKSDKNKEAIQAAGAIPLLANLLESKNEDLLIPVVGILQECASDENYRIAIRSSGMIKFLVENLSSKNQALQAHCASAIFKCAEDDEARVIVQQYGGLKLLVNLLENVSNKELLEAATGAVWKCAQNLDNVAAFNKLNTVKKLVGLIENQPEDVLVNVVGALGACAQTPQGRQAIRESNGITPLVSLLKSTNQALLVNVTTAIGACALDSDSMVVIDRLDGVRLLWSQLKSPSHHVQASAAWAISPCIEHAKDAGEMVRSFVGGLELIVSLLKSEHVEVLASVCAAIANIAKDEENLAVITDHGVVPMLAKLTTTKSDRLRKNLAESIARCCRWGNNRVAFGSAGAVAPLVRFLKSHDEEVHAATARALHQLSMDPDNCIAMHENGVVHLLLGMVGSNETELQEAAAGTIGNIRRLALASEKAASA